MTSRPPQSDRVAPPVRGSKHAKLYRRVLFLLLLPVITGILVELLFSASVVFGLLSLPLPVFAGDKTHEALLFDSRIGFRLAQTPTRYKEFVAHEEVFDSELRGNNMGFRDDHDFQPARRDPGQRRFAVLGDSFTAEPFLKQNWPDAAEALFTQGGHDIELLNMAQEGNGLANWWAVVKYVLEEKQFDIDGLILFIHWDDLERKYGYAWSTPSYAHFQESTSWDPLDWPDAQPTPPLFAYPYMRRVSPEALDDPNYRPRNYAIPYLWTIGAMFVRDSDYEEDIASPRWHPAQHCLALEIAQSAIANNWNTLIVTDHNGPDGRILPKVLDLAAWMYAPIIDANRMFAGMTAQQQEEHFFTRDRHWNQQGSNLFAAYIYAAILDWLDQTPRLQP